MSFVGMRVLLQSGAVCAHAYAPRENAFMVWFHAHENVILMGMSVLRCGTVGPHDIHFGSARPPRLTLRISSRAPTPSAAAVSSRQRKVRGIHQRA